MPYEVESPLAAGMGVASGILQGQEEARKAKAEAERQARLDAQEAAYKQAQIADMQSQMRQRDSNANLNTARIAQIQAILPYLPLEKQALIANLIATGQLTDAKVKEILTATIPNVQATTKLTTAKTETEKKRPALVQAQTQNTIDLPTSRRLAIEGREADAVIAAQAAAARAAAAQAAAWDRFTAGQAGADERQERQFQHDDKKTGVTLNPVLQAMLTQVATGQTDKRGADTYVMSNPTFSTDQKAEFERQLAKMPAPKPASAKASPQDAGRAQTLRAKIKMITLGNPDVTSAQLRAAAKADGYPDSVINLVLPGGP